MASEIEHFLQDSGSAPYTELCKICLRNKSKYVCPRCNTPYCSLECYKSEMHLDCSESFYHEWVEKELKSNKVSVEGQKRMLEILSRMNEVENDGALDSDDEDPIPDLGERLSGIDLNDADKVWEKLSEHEKAAFQELIKSGNVADIIQSWEAWWSKKFDEPMVKPAECDYLPNQLDSHKKTCPLVVKNIKTLDQITRCKPSPSVLYDLVNILGSYALIVRYYNGDYFDFQKEAATLIFKISQSLIAPQNFSSFEVALEAVALKALICDGLDTGEDEINTMKKDVELIISGPCKSDKKFYILAALSDLRSIFTFKKETSKNGEFNNKFKMSDINISLMNKKDCHKCLMRIDYFLSWTLSFNYTA